MNNPVSRWAIEQNKRFSLFQLGRLSRLEYLRNYLISGLIPWALFLLSFLASLAVGGDFNWQHITGNPFGYVVLILICVAVYITAILIGIFATIQRFHDLGNSGWRVLFLLLPFANIVFACILLFKKGNPADNQYGPVPKGVIRKWIPISIVAILFGLGIAFFVTAIFASNGSNPLKFFPFSLMSGPMNAQIMSIDAEQISAYKLQTGNFPPSLFLLYMQLSSSTMESSFTPNDVWNNKLVFTTSSGGSFTLRSAGPDGILNTSDDIVQTY